MTDELNARAVANKLDEVLSAIAKLHDQVITLRRHVIGENPVRDALTWFDEGWMKTYQTNEHYSFNRSTDPAHVKRWLKTMDLTTLKSRITRYLDDRDEFLVRTRHPFNMLVQRMNTYAAGQPRSIFSDVDAPRDPIGCEHDPRCTSDVQHTQKVQQEHRQL